MGVLMSVRIFKNNILVVGAKVFDFISKQHTSNPDTIGSLNDKKNKLEFGFYENVDNFKLIEFCFWVDWFIIIKQIWLSNTVEFLKLLKKYFS